MLRYAGPIWRDGEPGEGTVHVQAGRIVEWSERVDPKAQPAAILDGVHNYHTHVGDAFLRGRDLPRNLDALVRPVTGYKHRMLARVSRGVQESAIRRVLHDMFVEGTRSVLDFREQGVAGVRTVRGVLRASDLEAPEVRLLGRPSHWPPRGPELEALVEAADGVGVPSLADVGPEGLRQAAAECHRVRKPLALHASEGRREDVDVILAAKPELLVHLSSATPKDVRKVADAGVPIVVCPTSNAFFGLRSPVAALHKAGARFYFGTDNAMLGTTDLVAEARRAHKWAPKVRDAVLLEALSMPPEKAIKRIRPVLAASTPRRRAIVLSRRGSRVQWGARPGVFDR